MWPQALWFDEGDLLQDTRAASLYQNAWIDYEDAKEKDALSTPALKMLGDVSIAASAGTNYFDYEATMRRSAAGAWSVSAMAET